MYSSRGGNTYGQQQPPYASQSAYAQNLGSAYSGSAVGGPDGGSQLSMASRHSSMLGGPQESDISAYRSHPSAGAHFGGQYSSVYGSAALSSGQQVPGMSTKGAGPSALEGRSGYGSTMPDSPKFTSGDYVSSSSHGYGHKNDQLFSDKISDYSSIDRRQFGERQSAYVGRDLQNESTGRYSDSIGFGTQHQPDMYNRMDQASLLRQEQMLKSQSLQSASLDGGSRQTDYLAARGASIRHPAQDLMPYGGRMDADPRSLSMLSGSAYGGQPAPSILGAAPLRNVDDLMLPQSSSNPGYGVSLPPGRDYATGKGLHGTSLDSDYPGMMLSHGGHSRIDERKDDRGGYARELERREEERRREHLREREKDKEREKERERERERDRERKRERERERERMLERREKERDRERERGPEIRRERGPEIGRERTLPRISRDRADQRGSSLTKDVKSLRRDSPRREASHRHHSPVKEKRREYACKVYSSSLVDVERDYLSLDKRYPKLFISPDCSKVVVNWPRENLKISIYTPASFEHDFVEEDTATKQKEPPTIPSADDPVKSEIGTTVWNAKMILMSGLSQNALEELSSEKNYDDRIPHFCNILRFAILKKDRSFMAIGGPWDTVDGGDPSVDDSSLVRTVLRYAKDITQLDLKNCRQWNRFLEIHYERVGKDGLFSHKEVTVLYVPDLSDCLPSLEAWRDQWLAHKKAIAEREQQRALKKEKSQEKKEGLKGKEFDKEVKRDDKSEKKVDSPSSGQAVDVNKELKDNHELKGNAAGKEGGKNDKTFNKKEGSETGEESNNVDKQELGGSAGVQTAGSGKSGKKKIIRKIVKQKVAGKKDGAENQTKEGDKLEEKNVGEKITNLEITGQQDEPSAKAGVKTFIRKRVVKKVPVVKTVQKENESMQPVLKTEKGPECSDDRAKVISDSSSAAVVQDSTVKTTAKKKIIKRVPKRKVTGVEGNDEVADSMKEDDKDGKKVVQAGDGAKIMVEQTVDADSQVCEAKSEKNMTPEPTSKLATPEPTSKLATPQKLDDVGNSSKTGSKADKGDKKDEKRVAERSGSVSKSDNEADKQKVSHKDNQSDNREKSKEREKSKDDEKKDKEGKDESRTKSNKEVKGKKQLEEPPRRPGLFLQTKGSKDSKLRSMSLSLDSLLDYTDKDIEESTFELSLFAETLYEMLQYQMGCRLLTFLQKLRIKFVTERNQRKRQREEISKESEKNSSRKRVKTDEATVEPESAKTETQDPAHQADGKAIVKEEDTSNDGVENVKPEDETDDEDPEEDPEEDEEMPDASPQHDLSNEENAKVGTTDGDVKSEKAVENAKDEEQETTKETSERKPMLGSESKENLGKTETKKRETPVPVDKEMLQAFRFFDRNRAGYIRVEDMRLIIHNLGKFLSHRDVKELVQSALLKSNTGRDDRILYNKLVRMPDI